MARDGFFGSNSTINTPCKNASTHRGYVANMLEKTHRLSEANTHHGYVANMLEEKAKVPAANMGKQKVNNANHTSTSMLLVGTWHTAHETCFAYSL